MYDVVIIGSGVAGSLIANELSKKNLNVIILEAGPHEQDRSKLMDHYFSNAVSNFSVMCAYPMFEQCPQPFNEHNYYVQKGPESFISPYNRRVGGTTWNWLGSTPRFVANDFKTQSLYGYGQDWPIDAQELTPWYEAAEKALGVHFDFPQSCIDKWFNARLNQASFESRPVKFKPIPQARDPKRCCGSSICVPICPVQAKYDATIHVNQAIKNGATLIPQAVVFKLETDSAGNITQALYYDWDKKIHRISGKKFILAAHAIESPKLLLQSASSAFPNGLANASDQVGRNLMDHPIQLTMASAPEKLPVFRAPQQTSMIDIFRDGDFRKKMMPHYTAIQNDGTAWPKGSPDSDVNKLLDQGLYGQTLNDQLNHSVNKQLLLCSMCEDPPLAEHRITLSQDKFDYYGLPRPEVSYSYSPPVKRALEHMRSLHEYIFKTVGATDVTHMQHVESSAHIIGTLRMGNDPKTSVVNKHCQAHQHANLYIAGSSLFPSSGTANPTLTLSALALRLAQYLSNEKV